MTRKQKKMLARIIVTFVILAAEMIFFKVADVKWGYGELVCYLVPYFIIGYDILRKAALNILHGQVFDENFLMTIATVGAFFTGEYSEGTAVMLFYQVGELFQSYAVNKSRRSIAELMDIRPDYANIEDEKGDLVQVDPDTIKTGDIIVIKPGEKIPLDGIVTEGSSSADTSALTGESVPRSVSAGSDVISGCINLSGTLRVRVTKPFGQSTVSKILELVENSAEKKSKSENFISKFARVYTPAVVIGACLLAILPPVITGDPFGGWVHRAMTFLVISCPCALVISVPLSFFCGIGGASREGVLIKGGNYIEALADAGIMVFDKTGTLTEGTFEVTDVCPVNTDKDTLIMTAALAECYSDHPIAASLKRACKTKPDPLRVENVHEMAGKGVSARVDGKITLAGNLRLLESEGISVPEAGASCGHIGTAVHVAVNGVYMGHIIISDKIKPGAEETISALKELGIRKTVMLTGDMKAAGEAVAKGLGLDECRTELLPADKVQEVETLINEKQAKETLVFVGDGINDAPVLTRADVGIAMGGIGSDAAIEAADIVLMDDKPEKIVFAVKLSRRTMQIVKQNIVFALGVKLITLILGALGLAGMWAAVFADVGVSVIAILNAMRTGKFKA